MLNFAFWTFCNALELSGTTLDVKLFWANMQYFSYTTIHVLWLYMVLLFTGKKNWTKCKRILPLFIIPIIIIILVWTDRYHGLMRYGFSLKKIDGFSVIEKSYGPLYWLHPIYGYTIVLISIYIILRSAIVHKSIYRMQAIALLVSPLIAIIPSILYVFSLSPIQAFDVTPAFLGVSGILAIIGLYKYKLFDIIPIARDTAVDNINIGMIVFDNRDIVIDANVAAQKQLKKDIETLDGFSGKQVAKLFNVDWIELNEVKVLRGKMIFEKAVNDKYYEIELSEVVNKQRKKVGKVILIRDITENINSQNKIIKQSNQLAISKERERMARDLHDDLGQILAYVNIQAQGIQNELADKKVESAIKNMTKLIEVSKIANNYLRKHIKNTRFIDFSERDFISTIKNTVEQFEKYNQAVVKLKISNKTFMEKLSDVKKINILYIMKEALNNIQKHSMKANSVFIALEENNKKLEMIIKDNGEGFDVASIDNSKSFGLTIMKERADVINGKLEISSSKQVGTLIKLVLPMEDEGRLYE